MLEKLKEKPKKNLIIFSFTDAMKSIIFEMKNEIYVAVARNIPDRCMVSDTGSLLFVWKNRRNLTLIQRFPLPQVSDILHFISSGLHYIALSDVSSSEETKSPQSVHIYRNVERNGSCHFSLFQTLPFDNVEQLSAFAFGTVYSQEVMLAALNRTLVSVWNSAGKIRHFFSTHVEATKHKAREFSFILSSQVNPGLPKGGCCRQRTLEQWSQF